MESSGNQNQRSVYMKICYQLIDDIINEKYMIGDAIPTQNELSEIFHVSRATVREAIKELIRREILKTVKGKGTFVVTKPDEVGRAERTAGFSGAQFRNMGREKHSEIISIRDVPADKLLSSNLMVPQGTVITNVKRVRYVDKTPMCVDDSFLVKRYIGAIDFSRENLETGSLYKILETKANIVFDFIEEKFRAISCPERIADYLQINSGEPILHIKRISYDEFGRIVEYCENFERSDLFSTVIQSRRSARKEIKKEMYDKIIGCILGAAAGDALGAITENSTTEDIINKYGHYVDDFLPSADHSRFVCREAGSVTDNFSLAYFTAVELIKCNGSVSEKVAENALLTWSEYPDFYELAGPEIKDAVKRLKGQQTEEKEPASNSFNAINNNESAIRIFPAGLINPNNPDKAIKDAAVICMTTHPYAVTVSANSAVAAAIARAMDADATLDQVLDAGLYGAQAGYEIGSRQGINLPAPSVEKRMRLAIEIGKRGLGWEETMRELRDVIGSGINAAEAIPCAFGILAANPGDTMSAIRMGINIGNDTDTIATVVGAIAGALYGVKTIPMKFLKTINEVNGFNLERIAQDMAINYYQ
jgi:ADP-ribosylglycohydrolase/DNA-binding GntR family transcriptional regulator